MGPELGCRAMDKLDILLIPFVLLLQMSLLFFALLFPALRLMLWLYDSCFNQAISHSLPFELLNSLAYVTYLPLRLVMLVIYWLHKIFGWILAPVYYFWIVFLFGRDFTGVSFVRVPKVVRCGPFSPIPRISSPFLAS